MAGMKIFKMLAACSKALGWQNLGKKPPHLENGPGYIPVMVGSFFSNEASLFFLAPRKKAIKNPGMQEMMRCFLHASISQHKYHKHIPFYPY